MFQINGTGLGLRQEFLNELIDDPNQPIDFLEIAPENWIKVGGKRLLTFERYVEKYPFALHGLSLSIGGPDPLNIELVKSIKSFMRHYNINTYSEHLSYCSDAQGYLYDLLPIPFTEEAVRYVADRIKVVQDILEQPLVLENASYYATPNQQISELDFILEVVKASGCKLLLDVNNVYVNSINHHYDSANFIQQLPTEAIEYLHIAGHFQKEADLIIDTHGANVRDEVFQLLDITYRHHGVKPTLLERDFNIPPLEELLLETKHIQQLQDKYHMLNGEQQCLAL